MKNQFPHTSQLPRPILWSLCLLTAAMIFKLFNQLYADYDLWWHIFMGNEFITKGSLQKFDIYSFTAFGQPYINHEWLSEITMAGAYLTGKDTGLIVWRWSIVLLILCLAWRLIKFRAQHHLSRISIFMCIGIVLAPGISFRVHLFSYLLLLILLALIYSSRIKDSMPSVMVVSLLFALWANLHGAFVLGLVVWFVYGAEHVYRHRANLHWLRMFLTLLLPVFVTLANPFGPKLWTFIYHELSNPLSQKYITEWQRFSFSPREMPFLFVMAITWAALFCSKREKNTAETIILIVASAMGLMSVRHTPLFVILTLPSLAYHMDGAFFRLLKKGGNGKPISNISTAWSSILLICLSITFVAMGLPDKWKIHMGKDPLPVQTVAFLEKNHVKGNLWVPLHYGGYVLFHLYPDIKVSIDGRWAAVYPRQIMKDNMIFSYQATNGKWKQLLEKYGADLALVETDNPALTEMEQDVDWVWIFKENAGNLLMNRKYWITRIKRD